MILLQGQAALLLRGSIGENSVPVIQGDWSRRRLTRRWFVNEAELVVACRPRRSWTYGSPLVSCAQTVTGSYRNRTGAHIDSGSPKCVCWSILKGRRWYRFLHPEWGDFTIAICSDLLDSAPWRSLRGELLHAFTVAFNKNVDLYEIPYMGPSLRELCKRRHGKSRQALVARFYGRHADNTSGRSLDCEETICYSLSMWMCRSRTSSKRNGMGSKGQSMPQFAPGLEARTRRPSSRLHHLGLSGVHSRPELRRLHQPEQPQDAEPASPRRIHQGCGHRARTPSSSCGTTRL